MVADQATLKATGSIDEDGYKELIPHVQSTARCCRNRLLNLTKPQSGLPMLLLVLANSPRVNKSRIAYINIQDLLNK